MSRHPPSQLSHLAQGAPESVYVHALDALSAASVPYLVGGGFAIVRYTGGPRTVKDLDVFLRRADFDRALDTLAGAGFEAERTHPHWLGKARAGAHCIDVIFSSGNGATPVDDAWFEHAGDGGVLGRTVRFVPAEELIWTKLFIMERERYDGGDIAHLLRDASGHLDWRRLNERVGENWRVLLSHLILFGFIYPAEQGRVPAWLLDELLQKLQAERASPPLRERLCRGTLLSREQYLHDVQVDNYRDARTIGAGSMSAEDIAAWTNAIERSRSDPGG